MKNQNGPQGEGAGIPKPSGKRPYATPAFRCEKVLETNALSCGKVGNTQVTCHMNRKTS